MSPLSYRARFSLRSIPKACISILRCQNLAFHSATQSIKPNSGLAPLFSLSNYNTLHPSNFCRSFSSGKSSDLDLSSYIEPDLIAHLINRKELEGKTAIVTGSTRGVGLVVAKKLAKAGANIVITGKSVEEKSNLPGTIYSAAEEVKQECVDLPNQRVLPVRLDVTKDDDIVHLCDEVEKEFGSVDTLIHNSGALWWKDVKGTPMSRFDLVMNVNVRGSFSLTHHLLTRNLFSKGSLITMSPPVENWRGMVKGKAAYTVSKLGMSMLANAISREHEQIAGYALWPKTLIESFATKNFKIGDKSQWRRADILGDCCLLMACQPTDNSNTDKGEAFIDEDYLKKFDITNLKVYRCDPEHEPPAMPLGEIERGRVDEK